MKTNDATHNTTSIARTYMAIGKESSADPALAGPTVVSVVQFSFYHERAVVFRRCVAKKIGFWEIARLILSPQTSPNCRRFCPIHARDYLGSRSWPTGCASAPSP